jgi:hypothetical protein
MDYLADLVEAVNQLKVDRDTWQAVALQYKAAFNAQTARLQEFQDICFATQAELENERAQNRRLNLSLDGVSHDPLATAGSTEESQDESSFGTALVLSRSCIDINWQLRPSRDCGNPIFKCVEQFASQQDWGTALVEIERLLRGPLSPKARAEGLLLKSSILQATGPESLYDALAACSEALELCDYVSELESLLPKIQYQRGLYYYQLRMLHQAREAFKAVSENNSLFERANEYRKSCNEELELFCSPNRRSAFDESRAASESVLAQLEIGVSRVSYDITFCAAQVTNLTSRARLAIRVHSSGFVPLRRPSE